MKLATGAMHFDPVSQHAHGRAARFVEIAVIFGLFALFITLLSVVLAEF
jgi:hypothetical protein